MKFCKFVGSLYPHNYISANFCRFTSIFHQIALIFPRVAIFFNFLALTTWTTCTNWHYCRFSRFKNVTFTSLVSWALSHFNTLNNIFYLLSEINIFNKLLLFTWHVIAFFVLKVPLNTNHHKFGNRQTTLLVNKID